MKTYYGTFTQQKKHQKFTRTSRTGTKQKFERSSFLPCLWLFFVPPSGKTLTSEAWICQTNIFKGNNWKYGKWFTLGKVTECGVHFVCLTHITKHNFDSVNIECHINYITYTSSQLSITPCLHNSGLYMSWLNSLRWTHQWSSVVQGGGHWTCFGLCPNTNTKFTNTNTKFTTAAETYSLEINFHSTIEAVAAQKWGLVVLSHRRRDTYPHRFLHWRRAGFTSFRSYFNICRWNLHIGQWSYWCGEVTCRCSGAAFMQHCAHFLALLSWPRPVCV